MAPQHTSAVMLDVMTRNDWRVDKGGLGVNSVELDEAALAIMSSFSGFLNLMELRGQSSHCQPGVKIIGNVGVLHSCVNCNPIRQ